MLLYDFLDASDLAALQADLDPMGVKGGFRQDIFHDTLRERSGSLILL